MGKHLRFGVFILFLLSFYFVFDVKVEAAVINPNQVYTYEKMEEDIIKLAETYPDLITYKVIGKSEYGRDIYAVSLGKGEPTVFINGSHHAREWLTTTLNMYMIDQYAMAYQKGSKISGYDTKSILNKMTIWFIPMVNPDGVTLQQYGLKAFPESVHQDLIKMNDGSKDFKRWKANAKGVDLNRQYDANWANIKSNPGKPYYQNYKGAKPHTAAEVKAVLGFVSEINPESSVSYHSSGEILFWNFHQTGSWYNRDHAYAKVIGNMTGYSLVYPGPNPSGGGFTDWFIITYKRPAFTPEISRYYPNTSPPVTEFPRVWSQNQGVGLYVANLGHSLYQARLSTTIANAEKKVRFAIAKATALRFYYSGNITSEKDLVVSSNFSQTYSVANSAVKSAENVIQSLPKNEKDRLNKRLQEAYTHRDRAAAFIDTLKTGKVLEDQKAVLSGLVNKGILDDNTVKAYHELSYQIKKSGILIGRMHGPHVRDLVSEKYILPAKILKETIVYEVTRYMLIQEIETLLSPEKITLIEEKLAELERLEELSVEIKEAGNKLHPGMYPELPKFEATLQSMKQELLEAYEEIKPNQDVQSPSQEGDTTGTQDPVNSEEGSSQEQIELDKEVPSTEEIQQENKEVSDEEVVSGESQ